MGVWWCDWMWLCGCEKYINSGIFSVEKHALSHTKLQFPHDKWSSLLRVSAVYTYEELARIENRKRTTYYLYSCGQEGQDICQGVQDLGSQATKTCQRLGTRKLRH